MLDAVSVDTEDHAAAQEWKEMPEVFLYGFVYLSVKLKLYCIGILVIFN